MIDRATDYALRVVSGDIPAGKLHRLACKRHIDDLARQDTEGFPYIWRPEESERRIDYAEKLTIIEGFEPKPLKLYGFQAFDIGCTFGWYNMKGYRRFRERYKSVSRQHGKSLEQGIIGTNIAAFSGYRFGQLYTAATKKRQAKIVWGEMAKFIEADRDLAEYFEVKEYKSLITAVNTRCTIEALSKEAGLDDGFRPLFASLDELHQMRDNGVYKALVNGSRNMPETLISMITTRGKDINSFAYEMDSMCVQILLGAVSMDHMFIDIFCLDEDDDPFDESVWIKSCPIMATTEEGMEELRREAAKARAMGGMELADYLCKCMNMWVESTDSTFIPAEHIERAKSSLTLDDFRGERCWVGVDLSSGGDLTSVSIEFEIGDGGVAAFSHSFMPRGRLREHIRSDTAPYDLWEKQGLIETLGGECEFRTDYHAVIGWLDGIVAEYELDVQAIGYDEHNADAFLVDLEAYGVPLIKVTQSARNLNDATVDMQLIAKSGKLAIERGNELLTWSIANARIVKNSFAEVKIDKLGGKKSSHRIDPVDALIDAHYARIVMRESERVDADAEMDKYLKALGWA